MRESAKKTIVTIVSEIEHSPSFEWIASSEIGRQSHLVFIFLNAKECELETRLKTAGHEVLRVPYRGRRDALRTLLSLTFVLRRLKADIVHTHLQAANVLGLTAALLAGIPRR